MKHRKNTQWVKGPNRRYGGEHLTDEQKEILNRAERVRTAFGWRNGAKITQPVRAR